MAEAEQDALAPIVVVVAAAAAAAAGECSECRDFAPEKRSRSCSRLGTEAEKYHHQQQQQQQQQ